MNAERGIFADFLRETFESIDTWLTTSGCPFTDGQRRAIESLLAGKNWQGLVDVEAAKDAVA